MTLETGQILNNRYRIVRPLGQGGFGAVYRAWDLNLERLRALKENLETSPEAQRQFLREAQMLADLTHPGLPKVIDHFTIPDQGQYLVMEFVEGDDLKTILDRNGGPLSEAQILPWILQVCDALIYLHEQTPPVIHRDIKPANIRISLKGRAVLVDFGIAKVFNAHMHTTTGARAVTPGFSPPEQYGMGSTDAQSDVYALGATLYNLLSGQTPPASVDMLAGVAPTAPMVHQLNAQVSMQVSAAVACAMRPNRAERFQSMADFKAALTEVTLGSVAKTAAQANSIPSTQVVAVQIEPKPASSLAPALAPVLSGTHDGYRQTPVATQVIPGAPASPAYRNAAQPGWSWEKWVIPGGILLFTAFIGMVILGLALGGLTRNRPQPTTVQPVAAPLVTLSSPLPKPGEMALIPAGSFEMGSTDGDRDELPIAIVSMGSFYIDPYEVSNAEYGKCVAAKICKQPTNLASATRPDYYINPDFAAYPVVYVNWEMAKTFCEWRGARLPTEIEWERAARGGIDRMPYPWGDTDPRCERANFQGCLGDTTKVDAYPPNNFGLFNMVGNVREWISTLFQNYPYQPNDGREDLKVVGYRTVRGGSFDSSAKELFVSNRYGDAPGYASDHTGFRCAKNP
jgi:formylglycine-generating enzyme required for sulfatase activity